eukprot:Gb_03401 [translate_table: standard]
MATEYRCFIGGLSWTTSDRTLEDAFRRFGTIVEAKASSYTFQSYCANNNRASRNSLFDASAFGASDCLAITFIVFLQHFILMVVVDRMTGRSRGFGFVTFDEEKAMEDAIDRMHGMMLDDRNITVDKAQSRSGGGDRGNSGGGGRGYTERGTRGYSERNGGERGYNDRGGGGGECFKCGKPGHFARECPSDGGGHRGGDQYSRSDRNGGGGDGRYGSDRSGDRYGGRTRDRGSHGGPASERYKSDRTGPYDRPSGSGYRSSCDDRH